MKLYYSKGACSLAVRIVINEIGLKCDYESVDLKSKKTENNTDFLITNPKGSVPALEIDTQEVLTENSVIQQYLADVNKATTLLPSIGDFNRYRVLEWLNYISTDIHKGFGPLFDKRFPDDIKNEIAIPNLKKKFEYINKNLKPGKFIMGDDFTLPDAYLFVMLFWAEKMKIDLSAYEALNQYYSLLKKHKSIEQSLQQEGLNNKTS